MTLTLDVAIVMSWEFPRYAISPSVVGLIVIRYPIVLKCIHCSCAVTRDLDPSTQIRRTHTSLLLLSLQP